MKKQGILDYIDTLRRLSYDETTEEYVSNSEVKAIEYRRYYTL